MPARDSMGPRLFSRGKSVPRVRDGLTMLASMGPRLFSRGKYPYNTEFLEAFMLQWGRGFSAAESQFLIIILTKFIHASMGPRLFSRGKMWGDAYLLDEIGASIGPRLFSRGKNSWQDTPSNLIALQWGRGFSAAESATPSTMIMPTNPASMGPRLFSRGKLCTGIRNPNI